MGKGQRVQAFTLAFGKATFGTDQDGPFVTAGFRRLAQRLAGADLSFVTKNQLAICGPIGQQPVQPLQIANLRHIGAATLLRRLHRVILQPVLPDPFGIGKLRLDRKDPRCAHFSRLFDDEIRARLFDRGKQQPQVWRHLQGAGLFHTGQFTTAFAGLVHPRAPFAVNAIKQCQFRPHLLAHHAKQVMGLPLVQGNRLPRPQGMIYIKTDFDAHGAILMPDHPHMPEPKGQVSDAVTGNWVDHLAPAWSRPYLRLSRADRPIGTWLLLLPCWWGLLLAMLHDGQARWHDLWIFAGCAIGAFLMRGAGCTWNDITDRKFDAAVERTRSRPIPSGQVSVRQALVWMALQCLISLAILLSFNMAAIIAGFVSVVPVVIYPFAKRFTWWPQVFLGVAFNWGALLAWIAHTGSLHPAALVLYLSGIAWTLFYDTIYAHQDKEDDALIGVKSTARLFAEETPKWLKRFLILSVLLMAAAVVLAMTGGQDTPFAILVALLAPWGFGAHMVWQMLRLDTENTAVCLQLFRSNRDTGLIPLLFFAGALLI